MTTTKQRGFTLVELLVTISLLAVLMGAAVINARSLRDVSQDAAAGVEGMIKKARSKALASTKAYTIRPGSSTRLISEFGETCSSGTQTVDTEFVYTLPTGASLVGTDWSVCYNSRGLSQSSAEVLVFDGTRTRTIQVVLGGGVRAL